MKCPVCNAWTEVRESRRREEGYVRRRECGNGHKFKTVEVILQDRADKAPKASTTERGKP